MKDFFQQLKKIQQKHTKQTARLQASYLSRKIDALEFSIKMHSIQNNETIEMGILCKRFLYEHNRTIAPRPCTTARA